MSNELRFDGRVAIVTGAGGGLGRAHALLFASRGARVVVNDLGGTHTGEGKSTSAADAVVAEIREAGGEAVANHDSVTDGAKIVKTAMDTYGQLDIVVNNAGILRDVSFHKMTQEDWDLVYQVHVLGAFRVTHAAWPILREQGYGRIVMTASAAGIYGNFGQANYAMAKLGLAGFANSLAVEGARKNVLVNTIAPLAGSRMTETVLPANLLDSLKPEYVSPLVARLCHESSDENGGLFEVGGGFFGKLRWERAAGKTYRVGRSISIEDVDRAWSEIAGFENTTHPDSAMSSLQPMVDNIAAGPSKGGNQFIDVDQALGFRFPDAETSYDERDVALYALAVGAASDPCDDRDLRLVYEMHGGGMRVLPTFGVIPAINNFIRLIKEGKQAPGLNYGIDRILHGEQYTELKRPLPRSGTLTHRARIKDIFDKGKHALVITEVKSYDSDGNELVINEFTTLVRGAGGWGGDRGPSADVNAPPDRKPDKVVEETIPANQALLYRLTGDWNPLHADPNMAKAFGFERPILHGLCTFGYAGRHVVNGFAKDGNPGYFKSIAARFADSVFPGETLVTEMWQESDNRVVFRSKIKERDSVVVSNAAVEFHSEIPVAKAKPKKAPTAEPQVAASDEPQPTSWDVFIAMRDHVEQHPELVQSIGKVFAFELTDPVGVWTLDVKSGAGSVEQGRGAKPDCTLAISDADFMAMATGKADPMKLFSTGKLKISGDIMASQKLDFLQKIDPERARQAVLKARQAGQGPGDGQEAATAVAGSQHARAGEVFEALAKRFADDSKRLGDVAGTLKFCVVEPVDEWVVSANPEAPVSKTTTEKIDATLTLSDRDLFALASGAKTARELFMRGGLRVDGDVAVAQRISFLSNLVPGEQ